MKAPLHTTSVAMVLYQLKLYGRVVVWRKFILNLEYSLPKKDMGDSEVNWKKVLWSDETKIKLFGQQTKHFLETSNIAHHHKHTIPTAPYVKVDGKLYAAKYRAILEDNLIESARELDLGEDFSFSKTMTRSIQQNKNGLKTTRWMFLSGWVKAQTSIQ